MTVTLATQSKNRSSNLFRRDQLHFNVYIKHVYFTVQAFYSCPIKKIIVDSTNIFK